MLNLSKTELMARAFDDNYRIDEFCKEFGCTEQVIREKIYSVCNNDRKEADDLLKRIKKNGKAKRGENPLVEKRRKQRIVNEKGLVAGENKKPATNKKLKDAAIPQVDVMAGLKVSEEKISNDVVQLEVSMEKLKNQHRDHIAAGRKIADESAVLSKRLVELGNRTEEIRRKDDIVVEKLNKVIAEWEAKRTELEEVRTKIVDLSTVALFVCDDSEVILAAENLEVSELLIGITHDELMAKILSIFNTGLCRNLLNRDIEALAKVFILKEKTELKIDVEFDNKDVALTYELVAKRLAS